MELTPRSDKLVFLLLRGMLIVLTVVVPLNYLIFRDVQADLGVTEQQVYIMLAAMLGVASLIILLDVLSPRKNLSALSGAFLGLVAGLVVTFALSFPVDLIAALTAPEVPDPPPELVRDADDADTAQDHPLRIEYERQRAQRDAYLLFFDGIKVFVGLLACYICISLVLQTKDDFRFVIPYVEFARELRGSRPAVVDSSILIDGRITELLTTGLWQGELVVPRFVLNELQTIADAQDRLRRARGRRGLEILEKLRGMSGVDLRFDETEVEGADVDQKLVNLAQQQQARLMTNDYNLAKVAHVRNVPVVNLNDVAKALRPVVLPGERLSVELVKPGEGPTQGVGYLEDGTMVVVEHGRSHIGGKVDLTVTSSIQTSAGRMIFGRYEQTSDG